MEDKSCSASSVFPPVDGYDYWKKCNKFVLDPQYDDEAHRQSVKRVKGFDFFERKSTKENQKEKSSKNKIPVIKVPRQCVYDALQVTSNLYLIAFKEKIDIGYIFAECEKAIMCDEKINVDDISDLDRALTFLHMVCAQVGYSLMDVLSLDIKEKENIIKDILTKCEDYFDVYKSENADGEKVIVAEVDRFFHNYSDVLVRQDVDDNFKSYLELSIERISKTKECVVYGRLINHHSQYKYVSNATPVLYEGKSKFVNDFIDKLEPYATDYE